MEKIEKENAKYFSYENIIYKLTTNKWAEFHYFFFKCKDRYKMLRTIVCTTIRYKTLDVSDRM